ncbi:MAG: M48 family metallopeptidase [Alphaproteobacteria bacterium]|nr:M48 family metallopeptidase [Alphaproteobacteria bacterium]MBL7096231.1 M48 family metallopeptidase [Alphaproteobacteria bacterium]
MIVAGRYFPPSEARSIAAFASVVGKRQLRFETEDAYVLFEGPPRGLRSTPRLASLTRRIELANGARFETEDNDGADALLWKLWRLPRGRMTARLEKGWPAVALLLLLIAAGGYLFADRAAPMATEHLAKVTLITMAHPMSEQALLALDRYALTPTGLSAADQARANVLFERAEAQGRLGAGGYRLVFRGGWRIGPNAFALPDGTIVMTDSLWATMQDEDEALGVFAHEISHVDHAHQLQRVYQISLWPAAVATLTGDISRMSEMAANLPGLIAQAPVPDDFERQADDDAGRMMRALGAKPSRLAALLERLDRAACRGKDCLGGWVSDHADVAARVARLKAEDVAPVNACAGDWRATLSLACLRSIASR